jgi:uncharacterized protein (DUF1499 family)
MKNRLLIVIFEVFLLACLAGCHEPMQQVDFNHLPDIVAENYYIVCPPHYCNIKPHEISPIFPFDVEHLNIHWQEVVNKLPRITLTAEDKDKLLYTYIQRTKFFRFPDTINVQLLPIDKHHSTIAIYSQSKYGYSDFGGNKARVELWLKELVDTVGKQHKLDH